MLPKYGCTQKPSRKRLHSYRNSKPDVCLISMVLSAASFCKWWSLTSKSFLRFVFALSPRLLKRQPCVPDARGTGTLMLVIAYLGVADGRTTAYTLRQNMSTINICRVINIECHESPSLRYLRVLNKSNTWYCAVMLRYRDYLEDGNNISSCVQFMRHERYPVRDWKIFFMHNKREYLFWSFECHIGWK